MFYFFLQQNCSVVCNTHSPIPPCLNLFLSLTLLHQASLFMSSLMTSDFPEPNDWVPVLMIIVIWSLPLSWHTFYTWLQGCYTFLVFFLLHCPCLPTQSLLLIPPLLLNLFMLEGPRPSPWPSLGDDHDHPVLKNFSIPPACPQTLLCHSCCSTLYAVVGVIYFFLL